MLDADTFWSLPRSTRPEALFETIVPEIPALGRAVTLPRPCNVVVQGAGGGAWTLRLVEGRAQVEPGMAADAFASLVVARAHLREVVGGALRDRGVALMAKLGKPGAFPDLRGLPVDPARTDAVAALCGSVAVEVHDRTFRESYRFVVTLGSGTAAYETASTTVHVDADEVVGQLAARSSIAALLKGSRVRIEGDLGLPLRALRTAFGDAIAQEGPSR